MAVRIRAKVAVRAVEEVRAVGLDRKGEGPGFAEVGRVNGILRSLRC